MRLFWPALSFRLKIWFRYYLIPLIVLIVFVGFAMMYVVSSLHGAGQADNIFFAILIFSVLFVIALLAYSYYIKTKMRYSYFIFLDSFGQNNSFATVIEEMKKLNEVSKSETFKKSLLLNIGADSVNSVATIAIRSISKGVSSLGGAGRLFGGLARVYGEEASRQVTELGNISAQYILYRFARKEVYGTEQEINENIYSLSN